MNVVIDTSAIVAIIRAEHDAADHARIIGRSAARMVSAGAYLEAGLVFSRDKRETDAFLRLIEYSEVEIVAVSAEQAEVGRLAYFRYGRGSGHPARLNLGDCFSYALARTRRLPLLFKGDDFVHTDAEPALRLA
ncbi:MAG: type II toxin-antitoxin system VapC family toxin [Rhizobiaceae bacterium]|nr:type II toxin-antitoxin system VapC family toxin [Rhizobiaceae bacterium]MCV0405770.1 type II toxin-antitoxin system VapC family toxin [Rhizobiaceae bacterium]